MFDGTLPSVGVDYSRAHDDVSQGRHRSVVVWHRGTHNLGEVFVADGTVGADVGLPEYLVH